MEDELEKLIKYLKALNVKYFDAPLSEMQIAILNKKLAEMSVYAKQLHEKNEIDPAKEPEKYLRSLRELNLRLLPYIDEIVCDPVGQRRDPLQLHLGEFVEPSELSKEPGKLKLSGIKVAKKGLNGHS